MNPKLVIQLYRNMGARYVSYRIRHEAEKRLGRLKKIHPDNLKFRNPVSLAEWKTGKNPFVIEAAENIGWPKKPTPVLEQKANRILNGELQYFNAKWLNIGRDYDWLTNPSNGYRYDISKHWSEIPDMSEEAGDIKFVWEKSRFSYLLTLIRYDYHFGKDLSEFVFSEIESWIDANPINRGPNWRCSQEISLRIFNWCYALYYYQNSKALTEERWLKIQNVIYASVHHVYHHIDFSRIAVRNNHAITETLFLTLSGILFPFIPETKKASKDGFKWFEQEIEYQIYEDGTFLQFSMNYHRVVIQLLSFGISLYEKNNQSFSSSVYDKAYRSLNFLYQCMQDENGWLPNYGSNDGAWFFQLTDTDYRDYRPQLNTLHQILTGQPLSDTDEITEDCNWVQAKTNSKQYEPIVKKQGVQSFEAGGYYLVRERDSFMMVRCGNHRDRPAQADNLHVDIWVKGENILRDSGTYQYNTSPELQEYFTGTASHNTVVVNDVSQMLKGSRFIWYYWSQCNFATVRETDTQFIFEGEISAYRFLNPGAAHYRKITKIKNELVWIIEDRIQNLDGFEKKQIWNPQSNSLKFYAEEDGEPVQPVFAPAYDSPLYSVMTQETAVVFRFKNRLRTTLKLQTNQQ